MVNEAEHAAVVANRNAEAAHSWKDHAEKLESKLAAANKQLTSANAEFKRLEAGWWAEYARRHVLEQMVDLMVKAKSDPAANPIPDWMLDAESRRRSIDTMLPKVIESLQAQRLSREEYDKQCLEQAVFEYEHWAYGFAQYGVSLGQHLANVREYMVARAEEEIRQHGRELSLEERTERAKRLVDQLEIDGHEFLRDPLRYHRSLGKFASRWFGLTPVEKRQCLETWRALKAQQQE